MANSGRPRMLDDAKRREICALVSFGCTLQSAAKHVGCSRATVHREACRNPEFAASECNSRVAELRSSVAHVPRAERATRIRSGARAVRRGAVDFVTVLDSQRALLQATFGKASSEGRLLVRFVAINRALGNAPKLVR